MVLNYIWLSFFIGAFLTGLYKLIFLGDMEIFPKIMKSTFDMADTGFELALGLTGILAFFMGIMKIGEASGAVNIIARLVAPFFRRLFPSIPKDHPVFGSMMMNFSANMLGLDNAATPVGLKTMKQLQELNPEKDKASDAQIMFLVLNTSGLTLIPISVIMYRIKYGAVNPTDVFLPILLATFFATLGGLLIVAWKQRINLLQKAVLIPLASILTLIFGLLHFVREGDPETVKAYSSLIANLLLFGFILFFLLLGARKKLNLYEHFIEGAKDGFKIAVGIIPYLVAILVAIAMFRASGARDLIIEGVRSLVLMLGFDAKWVDGLTTALMKPLSGSGARGMMVDAMETHGADSFAGRLACTLQGATDTTFYIIAVYFGSVKVRNTRYAVPMGLFADLVGVVAAIIIAYIFFG
jgi:spore maturation protein SpmA